MEVVGNFCLFFSCNQVGLLVVRVGLKLRPEEKGLNPYSTGSWVAGSEYYSLFIAQKKS